MKRKTILIILLGLNATAGGYLLISHLAAPAASAVADPVFVKCDACGYIYKTSDAAYPLACPECGKGEVYPAFKCEACGKTFCRKQTSGESDSADAACPYCGSEAVHPLTSEPDK
jgi:DNA-directed RNA polymerase subunit RPC12/RpoP